MFNPVAFLKPRTVHAHCDIPCGIYDPLVAKIAAQTVQKMVLRMQSLEAPQAGAPAGERQTFANTFSRYVTVKEEHAEKCKEELRILWADYAWPNTDANEIAGKFNSAMKLAGQCKQTVSMETRKRWLRRATISHPHFGQPRTWTTVIPTPPPAMGRRGMKLP